MSNKQRLPTSKQALGVVTNNQYTLQHYYDWLLEIAITMFEWKNLPKEIDPRYLEYILFYEGTILFFKDDVLNKYLALPYAYDGQLDVYGYPKIRRAFSTFISYNKKLYEDDSVIIWNNYIRKGEQLTAEYYANKLYEIQRSIDVNVSTQKFPFLITCPQPQLPTMKALYQKVASNEPVIFATDKLMDKNDINVLPTNAPFISNELYVLFEKVKSEAMGYFGVTQSDNKKERMITSEIQVGIGEVEANRQTRLKVRRECADRINDMFGLNIEVNFREDIGRFEDEINMNIELLRKEINNGYNNDTTKDDSRE